MLTITRRQALHLRAVMRRAFGNFRGPGPALGFIADAEGLRVRSMSADTAVEYHVPGALPAETRWLPFQFLGECEGKKDEPVRLEAAGKSRVTAQWRDGSVPQVVQYDVPKPPAADNLPAVPEKFAENLARLLRAMADAGDSCDSDAVRYAVNCIQLRSQQGSIGATDGRQLLVQAGFSFPWEGDLLIPRSKVFSSPELAGDEPVLVGQSGDWVAFRVGAWTVWLAVNKGGRFPDMSRHIPSPADAKTRCQFSPADVEFLVQTLPRLPSDEEYNFPITLDLNGSIAIRAKAADQPKVTEVVLTGSECSGEPIRVNMNRKFLVRAARLGFRELYVYGDSLPVLCRDDSRQFVWAPLEPKTALKPVTDAIRIESGQAASGVSTPKPQTRRRTSPVSETTPHPNGNGQAKANGSAAASSNGRAHNGTARKAGRKDIDRLIEQAEKLRTALHDRTHEAGDLVKALKQHRRANRAIQNTLSSIRQLKGLGV